MRLSLALGFLVVLLGLACSHHHYGDYGPPGYFHEHRLHCNHYVACHYYRGAHHYRAHDSHYEYDHLHPVRHYYVPCHVVRGRHYY